jgi:DNA-binding PucR family transcriptional regulator
LLIPAPRPGIWEEAQNVARRRASSLGVIVLMIPPVTGPLELHKRYETAARDRLELVRRLSSGAGAVDLHDLQVYALLQSANPREQQASMRVLDSILALPSGRRESLLETIQVMHACSGRLASAAAAMHLHRNTVNQRVRRIEALTGLSVAKASDRLRLDLAVQLVRLCTDLHIKSPKL